MNDKLEGFYPVFWINLDRDKERKEYMEKCFSKLNLGTRRVPGYDGRTDDLKKYLVGAFPSNISQTEAGCVLSHLKAIKQFIEETDHSYAIILEDDVDFASVDYWPFNWKFILSSVPYDWDVLQLVIINPISLVYKLHSRQSYDFSCAAYAITRNYAKKLIQLHVCGEKYRIDYDVKPRPVAEELIYNAGRTYSLPLLLYKVDLGSTVHEDHIDTIHLPCLNELHSFWFNNHTSFLPEDFFDHKVIVRGIVNLTDDNQN